MLGQLLIALREGFEAALITTVILAYLIRIERRSLTKYVWMGVYLSIALSFLIGATIWVTYGILPKEAQVLFEGVAALVAVAVLTSMIYWMALKGRRIKEEIEGKLRSLVREEVMVVSGRSSVSAYLLQKRAAIAFITLSFIVVFREGLETVLFLTPFMITTPQETLAGAAIGICAAIILAYLFYKIGMTLNLRRFFYYTSILLTLLAAGLAGYGTHELLEYSESIGVELGWVAEPAYALNISSDSLIHHKGALGSIFAVLFGYTIKAEWLRLIVHITYLVIALPLLIRTYRKK
jgi:high-affinity iron transporter